MSKKILFLVFVLGVVSLVTVLSLKEYQKVRLSLVISPQSSIEERVLGAKMLVKEAIHYPRP